MDSKEAAAIAVASNTLANTDMPVEGDRTDANGLYQRRLRISTVKESAKAGAMNHGNPSPNQMFKRTITAIRTSVPTETTTHHTIELAMTSEQAGLLDSGTGP